LAREIAETFLRDAERAALTTECGVGRHLVGTTCFFQGNFVEAQSNLIEALSIYDPERDREASFRFGADIRAISRIFLAMTEWLLGEVALGPVLIEGAITYALETGHVPSLVNTYLYKAHVEMFRGDAEAARGTAENLVKLSQENALTLYAVGGALVSAWASARLADRETGAADLRLALATFTGQGNKLEVPFWRGLLAEIEAEGDAAGALALIDEALAHASVTGEHWSDAFLHRLRGEILLKRDPANTAPAEEAFLTAIAIAQQQKARGFELRAALDLARVYHSTIRSADAHALLASALEGFSPNPEFPEIEEAQALLTTLTS
jgi:predicted ATPase